MLDGSVDYFSGWCGLVGGDLDLDTLWYAKGKTVKRAGLIHDD